MLARWPSALLDCIMCGIICLCVCLCVFCMFEAVCVSVCVCLTLCSWLTASSPSLHHVFSHFFITAKTYRYVSVADNKTLQQLISIESQLEKLYARPDSSMKDDEHKFLTILSDLADRELVITISWAKQVPGKTHATHNLAIKQNSQCFDSKIFSIH